jgi:hypothetical protein
VRLDRAKTFSSRPSRSAAIPFSGVISSGPSHQTVGATAFAVQSDIPVRLEGSRRLPKQHLSWGARPIFGTAKRLAVLPVEGSLHAQSSRTECVRCLLNPVPKYDRAGPGIRLKTDSFSVKTFNGREYGRSCRDLPRRGGDGSQRSDMAVRINRAARCPKDERGRGDRRYLSGCRVRGRRPSGAGRNRRKKSAWHGGGHRSRTLAQTRVKIRANLTPPGELTQGLDASRRLPPASQGPRGVLLPLAGGHGLMIGVIRLQM